MSVSHSSHSAFPCCWREKLVTPVTRGYMGCPVIPRGPCAASARAVAMPVSRKAWTRGATTFIRVDAPATQPSQPTIAQLFTPPPAKKQEVVVIDMT
jgi:hypothetical protein